VAVGGVVGVLEISVTYPLEFLKRTLQLQQQASPLSRAAAVSFRGPIHCALYTLRTHGPLGLYVGFSSFVAFAGPRSAIRWGAYETLRSTAGASPWARRQRASQVEAACGLGAGVAEAALGQTPSQAIATKMLHDASPAGPKRLRGLWHAVHTIYSEHGVRRGFFCGLQPSVIKGGATNCIRFPVYGALKRLLGGDDPSQPAAPLSPAQSVLCGGLAGVVSAIATQPIDTVMAQAMGLESGRCAGINSPHPHNVIPLPGHHSAPCADHTRP
jgi:solute carrier family 25 citrate transporter 1